MPFLPSSRARLTDHDLARFAGETLFDRIGRAVCHAGCLPRKELFESWEMARRIRRRLRGGRIVDVAGGHGLLAHALLLLDDSSPGAVVVDPARPASAARLHHQLVDTWPRLAGRVEFRDVSLDAVEMLPGDVVVSSHACGDLTDRVLDRATAARARVAVLPCCHELATCDTGGLSGWMDPALAIDVTRAQRVQGHGYRIWTQVVPVEITPRNRLLIAAPC